MEIEAIYENIQKNVTVNTSGPQTQSQNQTEALNKRRSRWFVMITVLLGLICVLLLVAIIVQHNKLSTERDLMKMSYRNMAEEYNETLNSLKMNYSQLTDEREELQNRFNTMSQKKLELETDNKHLTGKKEELQKTLNSMSQEKLELETDKKHLTGKKEELTKTLNSMSQEKLELETDKKHLTGKKEELTKTLNSMSQEKLELETDKKHLTGKKEELTKTLNSMSQEKLELEIKVKNLNNALMKKSGTYVYFISTEKKNWSDSRQFCRDRGQDLVIINTEEEQRYISSIAKDRVWIGLSDIAEEGKMKWVDSTTLNKGFWDKGEPNSYDGNEDCVEIQSAKPEILKNWNDLPCSQTRKWICENL